MKSVATDEFRDRLGRLPGPVRQQASRAMLSGGSTRTIQAYSSSGSAPPARLLGASWTWAPSTGALGRGHDHMVVDGLSCRVRRTLGPAIEPDN